VKHVALGWGREAYQVVIFEHVAARLVNEVILLCVCN